MVTNTSYPQLSLVDFGRELIRTSDLDPMYIMLQQANMGEQQLSRWLLGYWCTYHAGVASMLSEREGNAFWIMLQQIADNQDGSAPTADGRWPRNKERRHWRAKNATDSVRYLRTKFVKPEHVMDHLRYGKAVRGELPPGVGVEDIMRRAQEFVGFGPWIAFKIADMIDALGYASLDFSRATVFMFDNPKEAAVEAWRVANGFRDGVRPKDINAVIDGVVEFLGDEFKDLFCPHNRQRGIQVQEIETVLCKWKSHRSGHYGPLNDIDEALEGLAGWNVHSETASSLLDQAEALKVEAVS